MMPCEHGYYGLCPQCVREERDELRSRVAKLERERDQLALSLSATRAERDHAVRSAELWESEHRAGYEAMGVYKHLWLEGRAIMAVCGYFSRMRGPDEWYCVSKDGFTKRRVGTRQLAELHTRECWTVTPLYAGSAPVPAAQADDVERDYPEGWVFHSADFSLSASCQARSGRVTLVRDLAGRDWWLSLSDEYKERVPLFVYGSGNTLSEAIKDASMLAAKAKGGAK